jgi:hypothetical protein
MDSRFRVSSVELTVQSDLMVFIRPNISVVEAHSENPFSLALWTRTARQVILVGHNIFYSSCFVATLTVHLITSALTVTRPASTFGLWYITHFATVLKSTRPRFRYFNNVFGSYNRSFRMDSRFRVSSVQLSLQSDLIVQTYQSSRLIRRTRFLLPCGLGPLVRLFWWVIIFFILLVSSPRSPCISSQAR